MKQIMYTNSAKDNDGVATFSFEDSRNFAGSFSQLSLFDGPIKELERAMISKYQGQTVTVQELCDEVDCDFTNQFVSKNVTDVLKRMELEGKIAVVAGRKIKVRGGVPTMPKKATILFKKVKQCLESLKLNGQKRHGIPLQAVLSILQVVSIATLQLWQSA